MGKTTKLTTAEFINKSKLVHGNTYCYNSVNYINSKTKVSIVCSIHGEFKQAPNHHLSGHGCKKCSIMSITDIQRKSNESFITEASLKHNNKYSYTKTNYTGCDFKVTITCPTHGDFGQVSSSHLRGHGCPSCAGIVRTTIDEFISRSTIVHNDKYIYRDVIYTNMRTKVTITCPIHGEFKQTPVDHLAGNGCPSCAVTGFDVNKLAILYYLKITTDDSKVLYKIGITNRTVNERFSLTDLSKVEIVKQKLFDKGSDALALETKIKQQYKQYQYTGPNILESGNTELFTVDILLLHHDSCTTQGFWDFYSTT